MSATTTPKGQEPLCITSSATMISSISKRTHCNDLFSPLYGTDKNRRILKKFVEECNNRGILVVETELKELAAYLDFLSRHVSFAGTGVGVPCMLLWSEWTKFCKRQTQKYPGFIHEKEFRYLILRQCKLHSWDETSSRIIYPGLEFVSDKSRLTAPAAHPSTTLKLCTISTS